MVILPSTHYFITKASFDRVGLYDTAQGTLTITKEVIFPGPTNSTPSDRDMTGQTIIEDDFPVGIVALIIGGVVLLLGSCFLAYYCKAQRNIRALKKDLDEELRVLKKNLEEELRVIKKDLGE